MDTGRVVKARCASCAQKFSGKVDLILSRKTCPKCGAKSALVIQDDLPEITVPSENNKIVASETKTKKQPTKTSIRSIDDFRIAFPNLVFYRDCPSYNQFSYAIALSADIDRKLSASSISLKIDDAVINKRKKRWIVVNRVVEEAYYYYCEHAMPEDDPNDYDENCEACASTIKEITDMHGVLSKKITEKEAEDVIDLLMDYSLPCPFCGAKIYAMDDECGSCERSLKKLRIPIEFEGDRPFLQKTNAPKQQDADGCAAGCLIIIVAVVAMIAFSL